MSVATFKVDTKLASILSESYRSTEYALKELVDNAWDADAENIWITLPEPLTKDPIVIKDDGSGMTEKEVKNEYLFIANSRTSRKGDRSISKHRLVKGRKGIGKFAGLVVASVMEVTATARGKSTKITINKNELLKSSKDLEKVELPIEVFDAEPLEKGTTIVLSDLNQNFYFPNPDKLKQLLIADYGRQDDFKVYVNGQQIDVEDIPGVTVRTEVELPDVGLVTLKFTVSDGKKPIKNSGIGLRVGGKLIGRPDFLGLDEKEEIPRKLLKRVVGEIEADGLADDVTADWGAIFENSKAMQLVQEAMQPKIEEVVKEQFYREINLQKARIQKEINRKLEKLPEYKRVFAEKSIEKVLKKFYNESEEKVDTIVSVVLDAFDKDFYWEVMHHIDQAKDSDISNFAEALSEFGILEMSLISRQAINRKKYLDYLERITNNMDTLEQDVHKAIESNLWIFGQKYTLMSSNQTLKNVIQRFGNKTFDDDRANKRPDLFLAQDYGGKHLLIEFKRPSHTVTRDDENQAEKYRDDLVSELGIRDIEIIVVGGRVNQRIDARNLGNEIQLLTFNSIISNARNQIDWLLQELNK